MGRPRQGCIDGAGGGWPEYVDFVSGGDVAEQSRRRGGRNIMSRIVARGEGITLGEMFDRAKREYADRPFLAFEGARETFRETGEAVDRLARALMAAGVGPGEHVSVWMTNRLEWVHLMFALAKIGAVMIPINTRFRTEDLRYVVRQSDSSTLITMERAGPVEFLEMVREACPEIGGSTASGWHSAEFPDLRRVISLGDGGLPGVIEWEALLAGAGKVGEAALAERAAAVGPGDTLYLMYTSGTTGFPKGVMQGHGVIRNALQAEEKLGVQESDCTIMFLPLFHAFGYFEGPLLCAVSGTKLVLTETFQPAEVLGLIESERGTLIHGFDTHWQDLMDCEDRAKFDLSSLRTGYLASGLSSTAQVAERAHRELCPTVTGWGMTECMPGALSSFFGDTLHHAAWTSGYPAEGLEFRIVDPAGRREVPDGTPGEILLRGPSLMQGYYKKPKETADAIDAEGFLHTGDVGVREPDGYIRFMGRYKEMLKVGGENVDPAEVEAFYLQHPDILKIQIVGVPDARLSEMPTAFVQPRPGVRLDEAELAAYAKGRLASYKIPRHFFQLEAYPMTPSGKVKRFELRALARERLNLADADELSRTAEDNEPSVRV